MRAAKKRIESVLRGAPPLYRLASRVYHRINPSFRTLSPGAPEALLRAFEIAKERAAGGEVGDYYEFGVFRGYTFLSALRACQSLGITTTRLYGFDSFQGLPSVDLDSGEHEHFFAGQFACSKQEVVRNLELQGMDWSRAELVEGFFSESLTEELKRRLPFRKAAVVLLDCDLYSSTREALDWIVDLLGPCTVLLFDDWHTFGEAPDKGQQRAFGEILREHPHLRVEEGWEFAHHGKVFLLHSYQGRPSSSGMSPATSQG